MLKFMLDTNICIFTIKNKPVHPPTIERKHSERIVTVSAVISGAPLG